jgi:hypothetical protein
LASPIFATVGKEASYWLRSLKNDIYGYQKKQIAANRPGWRHAEGLPAIAPVVPVIDK